MADSTFEELYGELIREKAKEMMMKEKNKHKYNYNKHYQQMALQPIDVIRKWLTKEQQVGFMLGTCLKYLGRFNMESAGKGGMNDLLKAKEYLEWLIELEQE